MYLISLLVYGLSKRHPSTEFQDINYDLMTFGDMLHDGSSIGKLTSLMEHAKHLSFTFTGNDLTIKANLRILVLHQAF